MRDEPSNSPVRRPRHEPRVRGPFDGDCGRPRMALRALTDRGGVAWDFERQAIAGRHDAVRGCPAPGGQRTSRGPCVEPDDGRAAAMRRAGTA